MLRLRVALQGMTSFPDVPTPHTRVEPGTRRTFFRTFGNSRVIVGVRLRRALLKGLQAILAPQACVECGLWVLNDDLSPLCVGCRQGLQRLRGPLCSVCGNQVPGNVRLEFALCNKCRTAPPAFDRARAWGTYQGALRSVLHKYKFEGYRRLAEPLAELAAAALDDQQLDRRFDCLIPVPSHRKRLRERGFDHTGRLAACLSNRIQTPVFKGLLRSRDTQPQFGLDRVERKRNLRGAFRLRKADLLQGRRVLLLDDLLTTGTTVEEACRLLRRESEVSAITVVTVARAILTYRN